MELIDRVSLTIFADIILIISIITCIIIFGWLDFNIVSDVCHQALITEIPSKIILGCCIIFILLSLKSIFFSSSQEQEKYSHGILLENEKGKLMISEETIRNLANSVTTSFNQIVETSTKVLFDKENNIVITVNLILKPNVIIKELSSNIQDKIKTTIKQATDLEVKEVNIKVKNIAPKEIENNIQGAKK